MTISTASNTVTEQLTEAGRAIEHDSFAIIDAEAGPHGYTAEQWPLVRRMIHANADFEFNGLTAFHPDAMQAGMKAVLKGNTPIVADVEMICVGLSAAFGPLWPDHPPPHFRRRRDRGRQGRQQHARRAGHAQGAPARPAGRRHRRHRQRADRADRTGPPDPRGRRAPALVIGMPVGFVSAAESKDLLMTVNEVPWVAIKAQGRFDAGRRRHPRHAVAGRSRAEKGGLSRQ